MLKQDRNRKYNCPVQLVVYGHTVEGTIYLTLCDYEQKILPNNVYLLNPSALWRLFSFNLEERIICSNRELDNLEITHGDMR